MNWREVCFRFRVMYRFFWVVHHCMVFDFLGSECDSCWIKADSSRDVIEISRESNGEGPNVFSSPPESKSYLVNYWVIHNHSAIYYYSFLTDLKAAWFVFGLKVVVYHVNVSVFLHGVWLICQGSQRPCWTIGFNVCTEFLFLIYLVFRSRKKKKKKKSTHVRKRRDKLRRLPMSILSRLSPTKFSIESLSLFLFLSFNHSWFSIQFMLFVVITEGLHCPFRIKAARKFYFW